MTSLDQPTWGILLAANQRTKLVAENLTARKVEHFIPQVEVTRVVAGRHHRTLRPLLGNYIPFIVDEFWKTVRHIRGVAGMLMALGEDEESESPALVRQYEIDSLRSLCDNDVLRPKLTKSQAEFVYGQRVSPKEGPFAYHVGRYDRKTRRGDAAMFVLFGREQRIVFKKGDLLAV